MGRGIGAVPVLADLETLETFEESFSIRPGLGRFKVLSLLTLADRNQVPAPGSQIPANTPTLLVTGPELVVYVNVVSGPRAALDFTDYRTSTTLCVGGTTTVIHYRMPTGKLLVNLRNPSAFVIGVTWGITVRGR